MSTKAIWILLSLMLVASVSAVPATGVAFAISSNNFTVNVAGSDGGPTWIAWGQMSGTNNWGSAVYSGDGDILVYGAPLIGGTTVYYKACDNTGCGNERSLSLPAVTPMPTTTFGTAYTNITKSHLSVDSIAQNILPGYLATGMTSTLLWGIMMFFIFFGFWFRTRSVRMVLIMGFLMSVFILTPSAGLYLGAPLMFMYVAQGLMAAAIAGVAIGFIRK